MAEIRRIMAERRPNSVEKRKKAMCFKYWGLKRGGFLEDGFQWMASVLMAQTGF